MTYAQSFSLSSPTGLEAANTIDDIIRNTKTAINERFIDILGVDLSAATDPQRVTKIIIPAAGMNIRNSSDTSSMIAVSDSTVTLRNAAFAGTAPTLPSGSILTSPTLSGTMSGGTVAPTTLTVPNGTAITNAALTTPALVSAVVSLTTTNLGTISGGIVAPTTLTVPASTSLTTPTLASPTVTGTLTATGATLSGGTFTPTTLNVPSGTTIPTHTETGTITATGSTRNNGTISGATLENTTLSGTFTATGVTISGGTVAPTVLTVPSATTIPDPTLTGTMTGGTVAPTTLTVPSGTTLPSPTLTGTLSGGTVAPTTLTVPSGTSIPTHTETGTITASGSTRNGGTLSGATLNNTTFTGTVTDFPLQGAAATTSGFGASVALNLTTTTVWSTTVSAGTGIYQVFFTGWVDIAGSGSAIIQLSGNGLGESIYVGSSASGITQQLIPFTIMGQTNSISSGATVSLVGARLTSTAVTVNADAFFAIRIS